jgi:CRP-like cAMP-binding protein
MMHSAPLLQTPQPVTPILEHTQRAFPGRELAKGDILYRVGDVADTVYQVEEGLLKQSIDLLTGKERIVSVAGPGDYIGALTPVGGVFQDTAEALSPRVRVRVIPQDALEGALKEGVYAAAGIYLARLRDALEDSELPVPARLARTFLRLGERFGQLAPDGSVRLTLPVTHDNLAAIVGAARETTTAVMGEMRARGVLAGTRGRYSFQPEVLRTFALEAAFAY